MHQQPGGLEIGIHVRKVVFDRLEVADLAVKLLALLAVLKGRIECRPSDPDRACGDRDPAAVERLQRLDESIALLAQSTVHRHPQVIKPEFSRRTGLVAELVLGPGNAEPVI